MANQQLARNPVAEIKKYISDESVKKRFSEMLGKRGGAFLNSVINVVRGSRALQNCAPDSIMSAAVVAATLNLPIDPALGQAAIVPYKSTAVFQIMYKGVTQLCIRSGQYQTIHCSEIYKDELKSFNPITGVAKFNDPATFKMRDTGKVEDVVGHYAYFKLMSGFEKSDYMTHDAAIAHAQKYSKAYQKDLREKKKDSPWSINPIQMGNKTILLRLLKKYGVMSIEMQDAIVRDSSFEAAQEAAAKKIESESGSEPVDAEFEETPEKPKTKKQLAAAQKKALAAKTKKEAEAKIDAEPELTDAEVDANLDAALDKTKFLFVCKNTKKCGVGFDVPKTSGTGAKQKRICPKCLTTNIASTEDETQTPEFMAED